MKSWMGLQVTRETDQEVHFKASKGALYTIMAIIGVIFVVGIGLTIWGVSKQAEVRAFCQKTALQEEQLKLLEGKTKQLEVKMKELDRLNRSILQTVSGFPGSTPGETNKAANAEGTGGDMDAYVSKNAGLEQNASIGKCADVGKGTRVDKNADNKVTIKTISEGKAAAPEWFVQQILWRIFAIDEAMQIQLANLYSMEDILAKGGPKELEKLVSTLSVSRNGLSTIPSIWPVRGVISSPYGVRTDPITGQQTFHHGIDIANDAGTPIHVTATGTISYAGTIPGYGLCVIVNHSRGFQTKYAHLSSILVKDGQPVEQGSVIGLMGSTGRSTGPHLHYEVIVNGATENPLVFLPV